MSACSRCGTTVGPDETVCGECRSVPGESGEDGSSNGPGRESPHERYSGEAFAIRYPLARGRRVVALFALLLAGSVFVVPLLALLGHTYRVGRAAALGRTRPPGFGDWPRLVGDGARLLVVAAPFFVGLWVASVGVEIPARAVGRLRLPAGAVLAVNVLVWTVPMAAVVAYLGTGAVTDAGLWTRVRSLLGSTDYWKGALWWLVVPVILFVLVIVGLYVLFLGGIVGVVAVSALDLSVVPRLSTAVGGVSGFDLLVWGLAAVFAVALSQLVVATGAYCGYLYHEAAERGVVPPATEDHRGTVERREDGRNARVTN
ncbi:hypothetical protein BRC64_03070 [Halobacteriales archaeon QH_10_67_22]|nr:MAG: hypothetical protein BRC64_03070 [Halobacteriales archaeon QH_10_67_22]